MSEESQALVDNGEKMRWLLTSVVERIERTYQSESGGIQPSTGFRDLDFELAGLRGGDLIVVAGRPSMGKTAFCQNVAQNIGLRADCVAYFSAQNSREDICERMIASVGHFGRHDVLVGALADDAWGRLTHALGSLSDAPIWIFGPTSLPAWSAQCIDAAIGDMAQKPVCVIVDGIQSFDVGDFASSYDRNIFLGEQVRQLKRMAFQLDVPVILTATLNREVEARPNKRPLLRDLRDIGMLEDLADAVLFIYRDELYYADSPDKGMAEIIVAKNSRGRTSRMLFGFCGDMIRFASLDDGAK